MEPIGEDRNTRPHNAQPVGSIVALKEDIICNTAVVWRVILVGDSRVHHNNLLLVAGMEIIVNRLHLLERESLGVKREDPSSVHVVDIGPHRLQRNRSHGVVVNHFSNLEGILVSVSAIVVTESPVGHHGGQAHDFGILLCNSHWGWSSDEVEVQDATKSVVLQVLVLALVVVDLDIHAIGVEEEDTMAARGPVLVVDGVVSVQVSTGWDSVGILRPESADVVGGVEAERVRVLSQTVQVGVVWELGPQAEVLGLKDDACGRRIEKDFASLRANNGEGERV